MHEPSTTLTCGMPSRAHARLVVEDAAEVVAVGEHLGLQRQERAARVHEVQAGQPVLERDLLRAQVLLHREREVGAALHGRVVGDHHHLAAAHAADAADEARRGRLAARRARTPRARRSRGTGVPGSSSRSMRSRTSSLPCSRWRRTASSPPPARAAASRSRSCATEPVHVRRVVAELGRRRLDVRLQDGHGMSRVTSARLSRPRQMPSSRAVRMRVAVERHALHPLGGLGERHVAHRRRVERDHHARLALRQRAHRGGAEAQRDQPVEGGRRAAAQQVAEHHVARLAAGAPARSRAPPSRPRRRAARRPGLLLDHRVAGRPSGARPRPPRRSRSCGPASRAPRSSRRRSRCRTGSPGSGSRRPSPEMPALSAIQPA